MLRHFRSVVFWLALVAVSFNGLASVAIGRLQSAPAPMGHSMGTAMQAADSAMPVPMAEQAGDRSGCSSGTHCGEPMGVHCMASPACSPFLVGDLSTGSLLALFKAAPPAIASARLNASFLTDAPERPPRHFA